MPDLLGLGEDEFEKYRAYTLRCGLAKESKDPNEAGILQPTQAGKALVSLIKRLDVLGAEEQKQPEDITAHRTIKLPEGLKPGMVKDRLLQAYVLEQAEIVRIEAQLKAGADNQETVEESEADALVAEYESHRNQLDLLSQFIGLLPRLLGEKTGQNES